MNWRFIAVVLLLLVAFGGCSKSAVPGGSGGGGTFIGGKWTTYGQWGDTTGFLVITDLTEDDPGMYPGRWTNKNGIVTAYVSRPTSDGRLFSMYCEMRAPREGIMVINGQRFELRDGVVFLVRFPPREPDSDFSPVVTQLNINAPRHETIDSELARLRKEHSAIDVFIGRR